MHGRFGESTKQQATFGSLMVEYHSRRLKETNSEGDPLPFLKTKIPPWGRRGNNKGFKRYCRGVAKAM